MLRYYPREFFLMSDRGRLRIGIQNQNVVVLNTTHAYQKYYNKTGIVHYTSIFSLSINPRLQSKTKTIRGWRLGIMGSPIEAKPIQHRNNVVYRNFRGPLIRLPLCRKGSGFFSERSKIFRWKTVRRKKKNLT